MDITFGRDLCCNLEESERREWLVTNGLGSYASGSVAGLLTRRYHGLLVAALNPPEDRYLLVTKLDETAVYNEKEHPLFSNRWPNGTTGPDGYKYIESFVLENSIPVWRYCISDAIMEKRIWMKQGEDTTFIRYSLTRGLLPLTLNIKALVNYRSYHELTRAGNWKMDVRSVGSGLKISAFDKAVPFYIASCKGKFEPQNEWYYGFSLTVEAERGLDCLDDNLYAGSLTSTLYSGESLTIALSTLEPNMMDPDSELATKRDYEDSILKKLNSRKLRYTKTLTDKIGRLALAGDQFIVDGRDSENNSGKTIIAGYHWFGDWGRDTMISLSGLTLYTGRPELARSILTTFSRYVDMGMLPNRFPIAEDTPEYNTVDAALWFFQASYSYYQYTKDAEFLNDIFPTLSEIIQWYMKGTRYNIKADPDDGLVYAGKEGMQLTWMDAKIGERVITPRIGKPVEVNALWYNALVIMSEFAKKLKKSPSIYESYKEKILAGFNRFWIKDKGYCYDVIDGPGGHDCSLRPNQILAISLPNTPLSPEQQRKIVDVCSLKLLTSFGLRGLSPDHSDYKGIYTGDQSERDGAYHQGTVWGWLLGHFALAHFKVYKDPGKSMGYLEPIFQNLNTHGISSLSEIFDGDTPYNPKGCIAQAWTVAEILRSYSEISKNMQSDQKVYK